MANLEDTVTMSSMTRISTEPASPRRWLMTVGGTRLAFPTLMESMSAVDVRLSDVLKEKGVANQ